MKKLIILLAFAFAGCSDGADIVYRHYCKSDSSRAELKRFVLECSKVSNNMSDEEMEDVIRQCEWSGENIICPMVPHRLNRYQQFEPVNP